MRRSTDSSSALFLLLLIRMTRCGTRFRVGIAVRGKSDRRVIVARNSIVACDNLRRSRGRPTINTSDSANHFAHHEVLYGGLGMTN